MICKTYFQLWVDGEASVRNLFQVMIEQPSDAFNQMAQMILKLKFKIFTIIILTAQWILPQIRKLSLKTIKSCEFLKYKHNL